MFEKTREYIAKLKYKLFTFSWKILNPPRECEFKAICSGFNIESVTCTKEPSSYCGIRRKFIDDLDEED